MSQLDFLMSLFLSIMSSILSLRAFFSMSSMSSRSGFPTLSSAHRPSLLLRSSSRRLSGELCLFGERSGLREKLLLNFPKDFPLPLPGLSRLNLSMRPPRKSLESLKLSFHRPREPRIGLNLARALNPPRPLNLLPNGDRERLRE